MNRPKAFQTDNYRGSDFILALLSTAAVFLNPAITERTADPATPVSFFQDLTAAIRQIPMQQLFVFFFGFILFRRAHSWYDREPVEKRRSLNMVCLPAAILFALSVTVGMSFDGAGSLLYFEASRFQLIKNLLITAGYAMLTFAGLRLLFCMLDQNAIRFTDRIHCPRPLRWLAACVRKRPFLTIFCIFLLCFLPFAIKSYPGILMGDTIMQTRQILDPSYVPPYNQISPEGHLYNHHPILHTLLQGLFLKAGMALFHSYNVGIFAFGLFQMLTLTALLSWALAVLLRTGAIRTRLLVFFLPYYLLHPMIHNYMMLYTKDVLYAAFLIVMILMIYLHYRRLMTLNDRIVWCLSIAGLILFRNDGIYLVLTALLIMCFGRRNRKQLIALLAASAALFVLWNHVVLPVFQVAPGSRREMLSIPFQQTARYLREYRDEVTPEEEAAIDAVLEYQEIAGRYNPNLSDPVKGLYRKDVSDEDLKRYFRVWAEMFRKHPGVYVQAFIHNKYQFVSPTGKRAQNYNFHGSERRMEQLNKKLHGEYFSYPEETAHARSIYRGIQDAVFDLPILNLFVQTWTYVWFVLIWILSLLRNRRRQMYPYIGFLLIQMLIFIAGPTNGTYFRYVYPIAVCLPLLLGISRGLNNYKT